MIIDAYELQVEVKKISVFHFTSDGGSEIVFFLRTVSPHEGAGSRGT
jgi:hypothetical protein